MNNYVCILMAALILVISAATVSEAGYRREAWGSKTWTGPGRPPHWSAAPIQPHKPPLRPIHPIVPGKPVDPEWGVKPPVGGGYWKDKNNRWNYHRYRRPGFIYYQRVPDPETVIIEREISVPIYVPVRKGPSKLQCGGRTTTRTDPQSGELIIEYVSSSRDCP